MKTQANMPQTLKSRLSRFSFLSLIGLTWCAISFLMVACAPRVMLPSDQVVPPTLSDNIFISFDGAPLTYQKWLPPTGDIKSIVIALHGFNDYSQFFENTGIWLSQFGVASFAYDQRGFGQSSNAGLWSGSLAMQKDLKSFIAIIQNKHSNIPIYVLGESMGGAVVMTSMAQENAPQVSGLILVAPAVWGEQTMPWYQRWALNVASYTVPWMTLTGRGLKITPSDNIPMLRKLGKDPYIIKETRVDAIYGLTILMGEALRSASELNQNTLVLYGERDEIIPKHPTKMMLDKLPNSEKHPKKIALYEHGYHMLLRDLKASIPQQDILSWMKKPKSPLPSKADMKSIQALLEKE